MEGCPPKDWQPLEEHLRNVAELAAEFARPFAAEEWAYIAGIRHDEGKATNRFQNYLREVFNAQKDDSLTAAHVDHSTAGAQQAVKNYSLPGYLLAYAIAGHHGGLPNGISAYKSLHKRLRKTTENSEHICNELPEPKQPELPNFIKQALGDKNPFTLSFFVRMLFSTLTDADFLDTERFLNPERADGRIHWDENTLKYFEKALDLYAERLPESKSIVNIERKRVRDACINAAEKEAGLFSLTVPTGGGKTLSSLAFALKHARLHGMRRIIYVIPFTTIVEQTADVFRNVLSTFDKNLAESAITEHHSTFEPDHETLQSRLATENWDAPLIITTSVQFYESLFSNRSSQCRKLHNLSKSVIILDEAQTLPVDFLEPCLKSLTELTYNYNCSAVLCTATQPAVKKRDNFPIGLENVKEIITDRAKLYDNLKRVNIKNVGELSDAELARRLVAEEQALCIVNTRKHAAELYAMIKEENGVYHLSALMCPAHRQEVLGQIFKSLNENELCRVVSTQLIEAGIDIDFPVVFRSMAGVDAVAQAAGRCNRHGQNPKGGETIVFTSEHQSAERFFAETANCGREIMELYEDPLEIEAVDHYFRLYYWDNSERWDAKSILKSYQLDKNNPDFPFLFDFAEAANKFRLIDDQQKSVIVPWEEEGWELCEKLRYMPSPDRDLLRRLQRYTVQIPMRIWNKHIGITLELLHEQYAVLISPEMHYSKATGLVLDADGPEFMSI